MDVVDFSQLSPPIALALALNLLGLGLKRSPAPSWLIPMILPLLGGAAYPFIAETGKVSFECRNPDVLLVIYGVVIGAGSVGLNQAVKQFLGRKETVPAKDPATETDTKT